MVQWHFRLYILCNFSVKVLYIIFTKCCGNTNGIAIDNTNLLKKSVLQLISVKMQYNTKAFELLLREKSCRYSELKTFIIPGHKLKHFYMSVVICMPRWHHLYYCKESLSHVLTIWIRKVTIYAYSASNSGLCISMKWEAHT